MIIPNQIKGMVDLQNGPNDSVNIEPNTHDEDHQLNNAGIPDADYTPTDFNQDEAAETPATVEKPTSPRPCLSTTIQAATATFWL